MKYKVGDDYVSDRFEDEGITFTGKVIYADEYLFILFPIGSDAEVVMGHYATFDRCKELFPDLECDSPCAGNVNMDQFMIMDQENEDFLLDDDGEHPFIWFERNQKFEDEYYKNYPDANTDISLTFYKMNEIIEWYKHFNYANYKAIVLSSCDPLFSIICPNCDWDISFYDVIPETINCPYCDFKIDLAIYR